MNKINFPLAGWMDWGKHNDLFNGVLGIEAASVGNKMWMLMVSSTTTLRDSSHFRAPIWTGLFTFDPRNSFGLFIMCPAQGLSGYPSVGLQRSLFDLDPPEEALLGCFPCSFIIKWHLNNMFIHDMDTQGLPHSFHVPPSSVQMDLSVVHMATFTW